MYPQFRGVDAVVIRATSYPDGLILPPWPDLTDEDPDTALAWLHLVWPMESVVKVVQVASPDLARTLAGLHEGTRPVRPRQVRRAVGSLIRYLLRWKSRSTPFGEFAGVASVELSGHASVRWGEQHTAVERPDACWLADLVGDLEAQPRILSHALVLANNVGFLRGWEWIVPCQPTVDGRFADVSVSYSPAVRMVLEETQSPIVFGALLAKLSADSPDAPIAAIEGMLTELVRLGVLVSSLRPPTTITDPLAHIAAQVEGLPIAADRLEFGERSAVDLRLDCAVTLPPTVMRAAEEAASVLTVLGPERPIWQAYHAAFLERYGPGAVIGLREIVDPDIGLGYPADYRGSATVATRQLLRRDVALAGIAETAALENCAEVVLDEQLLTDLAWPVPAATAPHTELRFTLHAATPAALDTGNFTLTVVSASRHAGTTVGRFLYLLEPDEQDRIIKAYRDLPTSVPDAVTMQLSSPPLSARTGNLARTPAVFPVLPLGEHAAAAIRVEDLAVTADAHRFYVVSTSTGQIIEPVMLNAVDLRHGTHPMARLLCEISTGRSMPCRPFFWGHVAERFAFLPRLRHGRIILSPARWNLTGDQLPPPAAAWDDWINAFQVQRVMRRIPDQVQVGDDDVVIRVDLTEPAHLAIVRDRLNRAGSVTLTEADTDFGWIGGRPHEIVVPMASTTAPTATARPTRHHRTPQSPGHLPGTSEWLYAQLFGHPGRQSDLLTLYLPDLLADCVNGPVDDWWFIRYHEPEPHLRLRLRLHAQARYGPAARALGLWAAALHKRGVLRDFTLNTYRPETGRFGHGAALRAAETVFAADSALVVAQLRTGLNAQALVAASYVDLAAGFLGAAGRNWLVEHVDHGGGPALDRTVLDQAQQPVDVPVDLVERRRRALGAYWSQLDDRDVNGTLADLLHLHHARMIGIDPGSERVCLRLARALAQRLDQHKERDRSSTSTSGHSAPPIT